LFCLANQSHTQGFNSLAPTDPPKVPAGLASTLGKVPPGFNKPLPKSAKVGRRRALLQGAAAAPGAQPAASAAAAPKAAAPGASVGTAPTTKAPAAAAAPGAAAAASGINSLLPLSTEVNTTFVVPLKVAAGISSSFLAQGLAPAESGALKELTGTEELE
jgi:hypothetical protein